MNFVLKCFGLLLLGYAVAGKGFAYLGIPPLFVGEIVLLIALAGLVFTGSLRDIPLMPIHWILFFFVVWGALRALPYLGEYGMDTLRDSVVWAYSVFALLLGASLVRTGGYFMAMGAYAVAVPWVLIWSPLALVVGVALPGLFPVLPGTDVPVVLIKASDLGVHLAGATAFLLLGLNQSVGGQVRSRWKLPEWVWWIALPIGAAIVASINRAGFVGILVGLIVVLALRPTRRFGKIALGACVGVAALLFVELDASETERQISLTQVLLNIQSIFMGTGVHYLEGTVLWRIEWWRHIINYTVFGDYAWLGKGYGINLALSDGILAMHIDEDLRSPHNGHMTILARSGIPGLALWVAFNLAFAVGLYNRFRQAVRLGQEVLARINVWLLAYWAAFFVVMTFDVFLEGPQGGIWYWSMIGFGLAFMAAQKRLVAAIRAEAEAALPAAAE